MNIQYNKKKKLTESLQNNILYVLAGWFKLKKSGCMNTCDRIVATTSDESPPVFCEPPTHSSGAVYSSSQEYGESSTSTPMHTILCEVLFFHVKCMYVE